VFSRELSPVSRNVIVLLLSWLSSPCGVINVKVQRFELLTLEDFILLLHYCDNARFRIFSSQFWFTEMAIYVFRRVRKIAKSDYWLRLVRPSVRLSTWKNFMKLDIWVFLKNCRKWKVYCDLERMTGSLHKDQRTFMFISLRSSRNKVVQKIKSHA
jgi:hypothetical protein